MPALRDQFEGREFDWFAVDANGNLGHFSTAGFGLVPTCILERFAEADALPEELLRLPITGEAHGHLGGNIGEWLEMARRGLYSFDWSHSGQYRRAATPQVAAQISAIPAHLATTPALAKFPNVRFSELVEFWPERECTCE
jgi:hypothetical protein